MTAALGSGLNSTVLGAVFVVLATLASIVGMYLVGRRSSSGKIDTSEASSLWSESQAMRTELRAEVDSLRRANIDKDARIDALQLRIDALQLRLDAALGTQPA